MTSTRCERVGQIEIEIIEHKCREFAYLGASVVVHSIQSSSESYLHA